MCNRRAAAVVTSGDSKHEALLLYCNDSEESATGNEERQTELSVCAQQLRKVPV